VARIFFAPTLSPHGSDTDEELADRAAAFLRLVCLGRFIELEDACDVRAVTPASIAAFRSRAAARCASRGITYTRMKCTLIPPHHSRDGNSRPLSGGPEE